MYKSGRLLLIGTNKKSKLCLMGDRLMYDEVGFMSMPITNIMPQVKPVNFYLVSESEEFVDEDEIKIGDYAISMTELQTNSDITMCLVRADSEHEADSYNRNPSYKKVLASTEELTYFKIYLGVTIWVKLPRLSVSKINELLMLQNLQQPFANIVVNVEYEIIGDYQNDEVEIKHKVSLNESNEVNFKIIKQVFTRQEVIEKIMRSNLESIMFEQGRFDIEKWIENNV
jgi:hypothetical protein